MKVICRTNQLKLYDEFGRLVQTKDKVRIITKKAVLVAIITAYTKTHIKIEYEKKIYAVPINEILVLHKLEKRVN